MGYLYLRDLKESLVKDQLECWESEGRKDLIKAHEEGLDIEIGDYCKDEEQKVV